MMPLTDEGHIDVVELCALLQCLGFSVKSMDSSDVNVSQETGVPGVRTVVLNCQSSGLHVVMEGSGQQCSCPANQNSSFWQVSAVSGGKRRDKETGTNLGSLPHHLRERITKGLRELVLAIKAHHDADDKDASGVKNLSGVKDQSVGPKDQSVGLKDQGVGPKDQSPGPKDGINRSASSGLLEMKGTPENRHAQIKADTPTRYRSLDTLTHAPDAALPAPGALSKGAAEDASNNARAQKMCRRQSTYTIASTPSSAGSVRIRNKTSSPIQENQSSTLDNLIAAEKAAEDLRNKLSSIIKDFADDKLDSSMSSLALDVSKISLLKGTESKPFVSSPNLSALATLHEDGLKERRYESVSTSNLLKSSTPGLGEGSKKTSRLRRLSPSFFKAKKNSPSLVKDKVTDDKSSKLNSLLRPRIITPVGKPRTLKPNPEPSPNLSASKKKYSHIKSTIPRMSIKKE